jgi:hypothetical protein
VLGNILVVLRNKVGVQENVLEELRYDVEVLRNTLVVLENCNNTKQAIKLVEETKVVSANNFLIADKSGDIVVVESAPKKCVIRRPDKNENKHIISVVLRFIVFWYRYCLIFFEALFF